MAASGGRPSTDRHRRGARAAILRPVGRRLRLADRRRFRVRDLGSPAPPALLRARPVGDTAVLLPRRPTDLLVGLGAAPASRHPAPSPRAERTAPRCVAA